MSVSIFGILFGLIYLCKVEADNSDFSNESVRENGDQFELESRQDFEITSEQEKVVKLLHKAKTLKENNYRRALENILPTNDSVKLKKLFEDLLNDNGDKNASHKTVEEVVITDELPDANIRDENIEPEVDEIELVIERVTSDAGNNVSGKSLLEDQKSLEVEKHSDSDTDESDRKLNGPAIENVHERTGRVEDAASEDVDLSQLAASVQDRMLGGYPLTQYGETRIPHYRTTITRSGVMIRPTIFTIQTSAPMFNHAANSHWIQNRGGGNLRQMFGPNEVGNQRDTSKVIEDFQEMGTNAYSMASNMPSRQEPKVDAFSLGNLQSYIESNPVLRHVAERSRSFFRIHH